jgi:heme/copper-type cytochrome/quinol oxidase subunit 2
MAVAGTTAVRGAEIAADAVATAAATAEAAAVVVPTVTEPAVIALLAVVMLAGPAHPDSLRVGMAEAEEVDTVEVVASERGFEPRVINLRKGDPVRLRLTSADREHCFAVDALRIEKRIVPGKATLLDLTPDKAGTFAFQCCLEEGAAAEKEHGRLVVVE